MNTKLIILLCAISAALAYPYAEEIELLYEDAPYNDAITLDDDLFSAQEDHFRFRRQLQGGGGGSPGKGFDISVDGKAPVWQSNNGRHQIDASGGYSQHLGGPYGNSKPDFRAGVGYTFRF